MRALKNRKWGRSEFGRAAAAAESRRSDRVGRRSSGGGSRLTVEFEGDGRAPRRFVVREQSRARSLQIEDALRSRGDHRRAERRSVAWQLHL